MLSWKIFFKLPKLNHDKTSMFEKKNKLSRINTKLGVHQKKKLVNLKN